MPAYVRSYEQPGDQGALAGLLGRRFVANVADVIATVTDDRLLAHKLEDGWAPLCAHLGVPVPTDPCPIRNSTADMEKQLSLSADKP